MRRSDDLESRVLSRRALVRALHPDSTAFAHLVADHTHRIDWPWVLERARAHRVAALLAARLDEHGLTARLPDDTQEQLHSIRNHAQQRATVAQRTLQQVAAGFADAGVAFFVIKGSALAERVYGNPTVRVFDDVDVVVAPATVVQAETVLRSLGYRMGQIRKLLGTAVRGDREQLAAEALTRRFYERYHHELPFDPPRRDEWIAVDLHWHIALPGQLKVSATELWEWTEPATVAGVQVTTLDVDATLVHLAVHATTCALAAFKLLTLCDVAWTVTRCGDTYERPLQVADAWGARAQLDCALDTVHRALGVTLPPALHPARQRLWLRPCFNRVASDAFLLHYRGRSNVPRLQRVWAELAWNLAMRCLRWNVARSVRVRLSRARWTVLRWRQRLAPAS